MRKSYPGKWIDDAVRDVLTSGMHIKPTPPPSVGLVEQIERKCFNGITTDGGTRHKIALAVVRLIQQGVPDMRTINENPQYVLGWNACLGEIKRRLEV